MLFLIKMLHYTYRVVGLPEIWTGERIFFKKIKAGRAVGLLQFMTGFARFIQRKKRLIASALKTW
jgi:hypothetical protein